MDDFGAPSFSLGLDFDSDLPSDDSLLKSPPKSPTNTTAFQSSQCDDDDGNENFSLEETLDPNPRRSTLKRLKRGPPSASSSAFNQKESAKRPLNVDDDIKELSSQEFERKDGCSSECTSSKFSLLNVRVLSAHSANESKANKNKAALNVSTFMNSEASSSRIYPKLTISPLRKFQLLDSDSDDPSPIDENPTDVMVVDAYSKDRHCNTTQYAAGNLQKKAKMSSNMLQTDNLWKDFSPRKSIKLATPALDEFCEEYFKFKKDSEVDPSTKSDTDMTSAISFCPNHFLDETKSQFQKNVIENDIYHCGNIQSPLPPAYQYFYHNDPRIQRLVRDRLCHFSPIGVVSEGRNQQVDTEVIDYMSQFGQRDISTPIPSHVNGAGNRGLKECSKWKRSLNNASTKETPVNWVNPRSCATLPRDAEKGRVHANGRSACTGHWYTCQNGRKVNAEALDTLFHIEVLIGSLLLLLAAIYGWKHVWLAPLVQVYVTKNGQELRGRTAYRHYRKESGVGFKRSRKKQSGTKQSGKGFKRSKKKAVTKAAAKKRPKR